MRDHHTTHRPHPTQLLSMQQAADQLGVPKAQVYHRIMKGDLPCLRVGRHIRLHPDVIEDLIERAREGGAIGSNR